MKIIETYIVEYEDKICKAYICGHETEFHNRYYIENLYGITEISYMTFKTLTS